MRKIKKMLSVILSIAVVTSMSNIISISANAEEFSQVVTKPVKVTDTLSSGVENQVIESKTEYTENGYKYILLDDGTAEIIGYTGKVEVMEIPSVLGGYSVTRIGDSVFNGCENLTSVTIPDSVTSIGNSTFYACGSLTSITIPNSVTSIGGAAFESCESLNSITIPDSVISIGYGAFDRTAWYNNQPDGLIYVGKVAYSYKGTMAENTSIVLKGGTKGIADWAFDVASNLIDITIPNSVTSIGDRSFIGCSSLKNINVSEYNLHYTSCDGVLYSKDKSTLVTYPRGKENPEYVVLNGVTNINQAAFLNCDKLTSVTIPNSVTEIGEYAFCGCSNLTAMTIPHNVKKIDDRVFMGCSSLTVITIPNGVTEIGEYAFSKCTALKYVEIPNSVTSIHGYVFEQCSSLNNIVIPDSVTSMGVSVFTYCSKLANVTLSARISTIPQDMFYRCNSLTSIIIPDSVTTIGYRAFAGCSSLTSVKIPESVTSIKYYAFFGCTSLKNLCIPSNVVSIHYKSLGYYRNTESPKDMIVEDFKIFGVIGSVAEKYSIENEITFVPLHSENNLTDVSTSVSLSGYFLENSILSVNSITTTIGNAVSAYDITLTKNGTAVQPVGEITISIPCETESCRVIWMQDDGTETDMNAEYINGCYVFKTSHLSKYAIVAPYTLGDVNDDGVVNAKDRMYLTRYLAKWSGFEGINKESVDLNQDGIVNAKDRMILTRHLAKWSGYETLPLTTSKEG